MRLSLVLGFVGLSLLASVSSSEAAQVSVTNAASQQGSVFYFPTQSKAGNSCNPQVALVTINGSSVPQLLIPYAGAALATTQLTFNIVNTKTPTQILNNTAPTSASDISIRAEVTGPTGAVGRYLALFPTAGGNYTANVGSPDSELQFGSTDPNASITTSFGIPLRDLTAADAPAVATAGFCSLVAPALNLAGLNTAGTLCAPPGGTSPPILTLTIGFVAKTHTFEDGSAFATAADTTTVQIVLADCPFGANAVAGNFTVTQPVIAAIAGDQRAVVTNGTPPPSSSDNVPLVGVNIVADRQYPVPTGALVQNFQGGTNGGATVVAGLINDTQYCFSLGYVNAAGWVSTNASWTSYPQPQSSTCVTPSQIDGFLNRSTCFIASAAYGEEWDPRLEILRQFRDQILSRSAVGEAFVEWYYSWSPGAAHWLLSNPSYKAIVRVALLPLVQGGRVSLWIRANMWIFGIALLLGTVAALAVGLRRRTT